MWQFELTNYDGVFEMEKVDKWLHDAYKDIKKIPAWYRTEDKPEKRLDEHGVIHFTRHNLYDNVFRTKDVGDTLILFYQESSPIAA